MAAAVMVGDDVIVAGSIYLGPSPRLAGNRGLEDRDGSGRSMAARSTCPENQTDGDAMDTLKPRSVFTKRWDIEVQPVRDDGKKTGSAR